VVLSGRPCAKNRPPWFVRSCQIENPVIASGGICDAESAREKFERAAQPFRFTQAMFIAVRDFLAKSWKLFS